MDCGVIGNTLPCEGIISGSTPDSPTMKEKDYITMIDVVLRADKGLLENQIEWLLQKPARCDFFDGVMVLLKKGRKNI